MNFDELETAIEDWAYEQGYSEVRNPEVFADQMVEYARELLGDEDEST